MAAAGLKGVIRVDGHEIEISRPEKVLFPDDGITKGELIEYYARIAPRMLPHLCDRPLTLERYPNGIATKRFFQKEVSSYFPDWIRRATVKKVGGSVTHVVCNDTATLVYLANQACITPHIFLSKVDKIDQPDQMVFDLDPQGEDFELVRSTARAFKQLLDELELPAFLKTTGSRGLHIVVPLQRRETYDTVRDFARELAAIVVSQAPKERHPGAAEGASWNPRVHRYQPEWLRPAGGSGVRGAGPQGCAGLAAYLLGGAEEERACGRTE